jgi:PAS domain S-box-containing protein
MNVENSFLKLSLNQLVRTTTLRGCKKEAAQELAKKYGPVLNNLIDVVFITDIDGHFLFVNKASQERTGIPTEVLIGRHFSEIVAPNYQENAQSYFQNVLRGEKAVPAIEIERQTEFGETVTVEINLTVLSENNSVTGLMGVARDVTDRKLAQEEVKKARDELERRVQQRTAELLKANELLTRQIDERIRAERQLKESEEKYRGLFENSGDAIFIVDIETGKILDVNRQAEQLTGRTRQEIIGMSQSRLHPSQDFAYYTRKFQKLKFPIF